MRVPEDILFRQYEGRRRQATSDDYGATPVESARASGDALSREKERLRRAIGEKPMDDDSPTNVVREERRQREDRRKRQEKVLLDTRAKPDRRSSSPYPGINVKA